MPTPQRRTYVREVELHGHIINSGMFGRVLDLIVKNDSARYTIDEFIVGKTATETSTARLKIEAESQEDLEVLLDKLRDAGASIAGDTDASTEPAPADGVLPDDFYATTNFETEVRVRGRWCPVLLPEMDCANRRRCAECAKRRTFRRSGGRSRRRRARRRAPKHAASPAQESRLRVYVERRFERKAQRAVDRGDRA